MVLVYAAILFTFFYLLYYFFTRTFNYWKTKNIKGPSPLPIFGNLKDAALRKLNTCTIYKELYDSYPHEKVVGIYRMTTPSLLLRDLDIIKHIMVKDFENFVDRGVEFSEEYLGLNLFHANEKVWRPLRSRFTPLFTTSKLKHMVYLIVDKGETFIDYVNDLITRQSEQNVHALVQKFTISTISACAFGLDIDLGNHKNMETLNKIDKLIFTRNYMQEIDFMFPSALKMLNFSIFPKEATDFFRKLVKNVVQTRNNTPSNRKDFMDLILELRQEVNISAAKRVGIENDEFLEITDEVIAAQAFVFYAAGYETSASTMLFTIYELAVNTDVQEKVIAEVDEVLARNNGNITYDTICELSYMEKVFDETLRKYPIVDPLQRLVKADYHIPGTDFTVEKGQIVLISPLAIHHDEKHYPDPERFDPERFSPENIKNRHPCAYLPFGLGPRNCIGMRFAKIQSRICLLKLFSKFRVRPSKNTLKQIMFDPYRIVLSPQDNLLLNFIPRNDVK